MLALLLALLAAGCGYHSSVDQPLNIPVEFRRLAITEVRNPTMDPELGFRLRSLIHDELSRRGQVQWLDRDKADAHLRLDILFLSNASNVKDADDRSLKFEVRLRINGKIVSPRDNKVLWDSGVISIYQSYFYNEQTQAENQALELAVRQLADRLGDAF